MKKLFGLILLLAGMNALAQNVGIGTTTPTFKLDVRVGSINTDSVYRINNLPVLSTRGNGNLFVGDNAGRITTGQENTFVGDSSGNNNTTGHTNTGVGKFALASNSTGIFNVAVGNRALLSNTTGASNTALGSFAMAANTTGENNTAVGIAALQGNITGHANTAMGEGAIAINTAGEGNVGIGYAAIPNNETGNYNVAIGTSSLSDNVSGSHNTALGFNTRTSGPALSNATAVGANAFVANNNSMVLGSINGVNGATASTRVGIGVTQPNSALHVVSADGQVAVFDGPAGMFIAIRETGIYRGYLGSFSGAATDVDFGTGAGNTTGAVNLTIQASPKFTIKADGNATLLTNELHRTSTGNANLVPIAYGNIAASGFVQIGSGNFTVTHSAGSGLYQIAITDENYQFQQYITVVTPIGTITPAIACTGSGGGMLQVELYNLAGANVEQNFHFVVYKP